MRRSNLLPEVNAGSMADIAFLLLIFFLVTASISSDEGISRMLPSECPTGMDCSNEINNRNALLITINNQDDIMVNEKIISIENLKDITKKFIDNNGDGTCGYCSGEKLPNASESPTKVVVSLQNGQQTSYKKFMEVQNELTKAYYELRNAYSKKVLKKPSDKLSKEELKKVKDAYPFVLLENEIK